MGEKSYNLMPTHVTGPRFWEKTDVEGSAVNFLFLPENKKYDEFENLLFQI